MVPSPPLPPTVPTERPSLDGTVLTELPKSLDSAVMRQPMPVIEPGNEGILVGSPTTFDERIKDQSSSTGHPNLLAQYSELVLSYRYWRTVRGDGNCYYRALAYGFVEHSALFCPAALTTLVNKLAAMSDKGRKHPMFAGSYRALSILLPSWRARLEAAAGDEEGEKRVLAEIHRALNTPAIDQAFIAAIRLLVGDYLYRHKSEPCTAGADADCSFTWDQWAYGMMDAGIDGPGGFVDSAVLKMEEDASDLVQAAAPRALGCCVRIIMVHRDRTALHNIDYGDNSSEPQVHLLFQPGHYELLIPKQPERYAILPIIDDAALVPAGVPVQGPPQASSSNEFEGFMQQVLTKYHSLWGQCRYLSSTLDQLLSRLDLHARPNSHAEPVDARSELTEMRNVLNNLVEAQRQLSAMPEDPMDEETPVPPPPPSANEESSDDNSLMPRYLAALRELSKPAAAPKGDGVNLKIEDGSEEALMDWPELQNSITPATASAGAFICGLCGKDGQLGGDEGDGVRAPCGDKIHEECLRKFIDDTIEKHGTPLQDIRCWQHERRFGRAFLQANMRAPESTDDAEMKSDGTDVATADEPEGEEPTEKCVICNKPGDLGVRFPCGCPSHKKCLESSVENGVRNGQAPAEIECPEHRGRRLGVSFLESTVPAALEPVRSVWSGFSSRVAAVAAAANSNSNAGTVMPGPKAVRSGDRVDAAAKSEAHKAEPARTVTPSAPVNAPWSARAATCDACRDPLLAADSLRLPCRHRFHRHCLGQALTRQISHGRGDGLQCPICRESVAIEPNDALLKSCLDPGVYYKLHSSRAPQRAVAEPASSRPSRSPDTARGSAEDKHTLRQKFQHGWRPCPKGCRFLGNFPSSSDAEFITCSCGYRYCKGCGVDENIIAAHDGRWHKPSCSYFKHYSSFKAAPRASSKCPQCTELHHRCPFPMNDGYPDRLMRSLLNDAARTGTEARRPAPSARN